MTLVKHQDVHDLDILDKTKALTKTKTTIRVRKMLQDSNCLNIFIIGKILFYILSVPILHFGDLNSNGLLITCTQMFHPASSRFSFIVDIL